MKTTIFNPKPGGCIEAIPSKSHAHRLLICAALADKPTEIRCTKSNDDIDATARCLSSLGADIRYDGECFNVVPIKDPQTDASLDCSESGSTFRFLLPVVSALGVPAKFLLSGRLPDRPLSPLYEEMIAHGAVMSPMGSNPFEISGGISGGVYSFAGDVSSQFTTGLLLALPMTGYDSEIRLSGKIESRPYIDMTLATVRRFGIKADECDGIFRIKADRFISPRSCAAEGDWSNAAFMLACGALSEKGTTVTGLDPESAQGDRKIVDILSQFGAECTADGDSITVRASKLRGIEIDAADIPDLVPVLSVVASSAEGTTVIKNCARLRLKESDRLLTVSTFLSDLGADIHIDGDSLIINGKDKLRGGEVSSFGDHRIAMSAAVASVLCENPIVIDRSEAVSKSYPTFSEDFAVLCGKDCIIS